MPRRRSRSARVIYFNTSQYLGTTKYREGSIAGKQLTFSGPSNDDDRFEELMVVQAQNFNDIQSGTDLNSIDFSNLITLINGLNPKFNAMKNFLIDTLTIVELARTSFNESVILAEQLEILQGEYEELQGEYQWLEEHCGELQPGGEEGETNLTFQTSVEVDMDMVYVLYQHFFGYPEDGVWDEEKANMIRTHLENREITTFKEDDNVIKIRYNDDPIKIELQSAPSIVLEIKSGHPTSIGDDIIITNILEIKGMDEINYGLKIGQEIIIDYGGENPEIRIIIGFNESIILNKPLEFQHIPGAIIMIAAQGGTRYLSGKIINTNGPILSYDIELDIGGVVKKVKEIVIEDGKIEDDDTVI